MIYMAGVILPEKQELVVKRGNTSNYGASCILVSKYMPRVREISVLGALSFAGLWG
jgi:hypothetical protein